MGQLRDSVSLCRFNNTGQTQVTLSIQTPVKQDKLTQGATLLEPPDSQVFFRGTVRLRYNDDQGLPQTQYVHLVQVGLGEPLVVLKMKQRDRRLVK